MSELSIEEGMQAFCNDMEREIKEGWGKWLTEDEYDAVMQALASFAAEELEFLEKAWCIENQDRLEVQIRGFVEDILREAHGRVNAFTMADGIADTSANIFNRIKLSIGDGPENDPNVVTLRGEVEENDPDAVHVEGEVEEDEPSNSGGFVEFIIGTDDIDFQVYYPRVNPYDFVGEEDTMEAEMGSGTLDENIQDGVETEDQGGDSGIMEEEEMSDNTFSRSLSGSQQGDDEAMDDPNHVEEDVGEGSIHSQRAVYVHRLGWVHGPGERMAEELSVDQRMSDNDFVTEGMANEAPVVSLGSPADQEDEGEDSDYCSNDSYSSAAFQAMESEADNDDDSDYVEESKGKASQKGKSKASTVPRYETYNLFDAVMDVEKPNGPPTHYLCKIASCNGFQGKWRFRKVHFEARHPEEWFAATGQQQQMFKCQVEGCGWTTRHGRFYLTKHTKEKHSSRATESTE